MRILSIAAATAFVALYAGGEAQAARWCAFDGASAPRCGYSSHRQCQRSAGRHGECRPQRVARIVAPAPGMAPGQIYPSRPAWSSPYECFLDDGGGRFRPCNAGGDSGGLH